jgi:hypothetical protein
VRKSMRSRLYWTARCATTTSSIWSNRRATTRVIINGRSICSYMQSRRLRNSTANTLAQPHHINTAIFNSIPFTRADLATSWRFSHVAMLHL